jgi:hypothetical protein
VPDDDAKERAGTWPYEGHQHPYPTGLPPASRHEGSNMSSWDVRAADTEQPVRRVRHLVGDGIAVICASLAVSAALVAALALVTLLAG